MGARETGRLLPTGSTTEGYRSGLHQPERVTGLT